MWKWLLTLLHSQAGQVPAEDELENSGDTSTSGTDVSGDSGLDQNTADQTAPTPTQAATPTVDAPGETFLDGASLDPRKLPPEVQPIFKAMQGAFTKRMQSIAEIRDKANVVDRFYNDQNFARETLTQWAAQNGLQLVPHGQQAQAQQPGAGGAANPQIVETLKQHLPPEMSWMAETLGPAFSQVLNQQLSQIVQPLTQLQQQRQFAEREGAYDKAAEELSNQIPHWQEHEDTMAEINAFLLSPDLVSPKYGSKLQLLYNAATANAASMAKATQRMTDAAKNRTPQTRNGARRPEDVAQQIMKAKSSEDAFMMAANAARAKLGRGA